MTEVIVGGEGQTEETFVKTLHGPLAALHIGLQRLGEECRHFAQWLGKLRSLEPLA